MIPKIVHYCWLSDDPMPEESIRYINSWHQLLPDYRFILWNRDNFDIDSIPWVKEAFNSKKYAFAADFIRLWAVYNYGGFYLDSDIELKRSLNRLLESHVVFGYESPQKNGLEAGCFGAEPKNQFIGNCLSYYNNRHFISNDGSLDTKPLPSIMSKFITSEIKEHVFSYDFFTAMNQDTGAIEETSNTYAIHHFAGSWLSDFEKKIMTMTSCIHKIFGRNLFSKIVFIVGIFALRIKIFGVKKSLSYYRRQYFTAKKNTLEPIVSFFRDK
ncbi:glycosyltransferase family 32 protein [Fibrobacter sp. UWR2]|uniref:glycosyltransferase family 32 protein n=1 Tax=Fibrobacter sp. UWR2 TaxID=1964352 RepID=UPI000B525C3E|nr:glycosyltransferase [Fibrobacter sp. UWR2]OWV00770.1 hypothetical protein B7994_06930 [Fibrobacter sp. UWR2]